MPYGCVRELFSSFLLNSGCTITYQAILSPLLFDRIPGRACNIIVNLAYMILCLYADDAFQIFQHIVAIPTILSRLVGYTTSVLANTMQYTTCPSAPNKMSKMTRTVDAISQIIEAATCWIDEQHSGVKDCLSKRKRLW